MKKLILFFGVVCFTLLQACSFPTTPPGATQETTVADLEFRSNDNGVSWLYKVNEQIQVKNGVFEVPTVNNEGAPIEGIGAHAIENLEQVEEIVIGDHILWISDSGICNMPNLKRVYMGANVCEIRDGLFFNCPMLEEFVIHPENPNFKSETGCMISKNGEQLLFIWNPSFKIPATVKEIDSVGLSCADFLESFVVPEGVTKIGYASFYGAFGLKEIYLSSSLTMIESLPFIGCDRDLTIYVPPNLDVSVFEEGWYRFNWDEAAKVVYLEKA